jgi:hypothetical protein
VRAAAVRDAQRRRVVELRLLDRAELAAPLESRARPGAAGGERGFRLAANALLDREALVAGASGVGASRVVPDGAASTRRRPEDGGGQQGDPDQRTPTAPRTDSISFAES